MCAPMACFDMVMLNAPSLFVRPSMIPPDGSFTATSQFASPVPEMTVSVSLTAFTLGASGAMTSRTVLVAFGLIVPVLS
ncbi:hypothetical protein LIBO111022_09350 [Listeria booriae]